MRIIAGELRSRVLAAPRGMHTRPTSDRLRETLFNVLGPRLPGARFLDLYAGSGANGLEALSRGAAEAVLVEQAAPAVEAIRRNISMLGLAPRARVEQLPVQRWLANAARGGAAPFDILFLDPPYDAEEDRTAALELLGGSALSLLADRALVVVEHRRPRGQSPSPEEHYGKLRRYRVLSQGDAALSFYSPERAIE